MTVARPDRSRVVDVDAPPDWPGRRRLTVDDARRVFAHERELTVGIEEELTLVAAETLGQVGAVDRVLELLDGDARFARELKDTQIEIVTPVAGNALAAGLHLARARLDLADRIRGEFRTVGAGAFPGGGEDGEVGAGRYRQIADEYTAAAAGSLPCGQHVHVGIRDHERALRVYNAARSFLPEIAALASNSPFVGGRDLGLASSRRYLNDAFHRAGVPPHFPSWHALIAFVDWGARGGLFPDASHLWWELRLHLDHGTLEFRVADTQTRVEDAIAVAVVCQSLVAWLVARDDAGESLPVHDTVRIEENAWRAMRYGVRGVMVDLVSGDQIPTRERLATLLDRLEGHAVALGGEAGMLTARALLLDNGAERQRAVAGRAGLSGLVRWLADETVGSAEELFERHA